MVLLTADRMFEKVFGQDSLVRNVTSESVLRCRRLTGLRGGSHVPSDTSRPANFRTCFGHIEENSDVPGILAPGSNLRHRDAVQPGCTIAPPALGYSHFLRPRGGPNEAITQAVQSSRPWASRRGAPNCVNDMSLRGRCVAHSRDQAPKCYSVRPPQCPPSLFAILFLSTPCE